MREVTWHGDFSGHRPRCPGCKRHAQSRDDHYKRRKDIDGARWNLDREYDLGLLRRTALIDLESLGL